MKNRNTLKIMLLVVLAFAGFGFNSECDTDTSKAAQVSQQEAGAISENTQRLRKKYPLPQLQDSAELKSLTDRANTLNNPEFVGYVYLLSYGNVMAMYTVRGKVSSLNSYMTAVKAIVDDPNGDMGAGSVEVETADLDGSYGENDNGIFFFTTEGVYVEWHGEYLFSNQPLKLVQPVQLQQQVK